MTNDSAPSVGKPMARAREMVNSGVITAKAWWSLRSLRFSIFLAGVTILWIWYPDSYSIEQLFLAFEHSDADTKRSIGAVSALLGGWLFAVNRAVETFRQRLAYDREREYVRNLSDFISQCKNAYLLMAGSYGLRQALERYDGKNATKISSQISYLRMRVKFPQIPDNEEWVDSVVIGSFQTRARLSFVEDNRLKQIAEIGRIAQTLYPIHFEFSNERVTRISEDLAAGTLDFEQLQDTIKNLSEIGRIASEIVKKSQSILIEASAIEFEMPSENRAARAYRELNEVRRQRMHSLPDAESQNEKVGRL